MKAPFPSERTKRNREMRRKERRKPAPKRSSAESNRIRLRCERFRDNIIMLLEETRYQPMPWFPSAHVITDNDDTHIAHWRSIMERKDKPYESDESGLLVNLQDPAIRMTNRIDAVITFEQKVKPAGAQWGSFMIRKSIYSPLPCPKWGRLPLSIHQWRIIAGPLVHAMALWQYTNAVIEANKRVELPHDYVLHLLVGWNMVESQKPSNEPRIGEREIWTGPIIFSLATESCLKLSTLDGNLE